MFKRLIGIFLIITMVFTAMTMAAASAIEYMFGDVDGSGNITASDALLALQYSVQKIVLSSPQQTAADVDLNYTVTAGDALMILQCSVGKITLTAPEKINYDDYELKYVEPVGFTAGNIYRISAASCFNDKNNGKAHDYTRLAVCIQGLINRNYDTHNVAIALKLDSTDDFWLSYIREEGKTYANLTSVNISDQSTMLDLFAPFLQKYGIILWDESVPSTANVAETICGLYNYIPVPYDTTDGSLYKILTEQYNVQVKMSLVNMFEGAKAGGKIAGTELASTGSAKCDAYVWALENYMDQCNPELLAYTPDGAPSVTGNPVSLMGDASQANLCGIPNQDYFIYRQCFFFDLTSYAGEAPNDDSTQPLGTDAATLKKILMKRYEMAGGQFGLVIGFPPWWLKYTSYCGDYDLDPPRLEWHFVEFCTSMNMGIEADAAHPCWMSNGSLYTNYKMVNEPKGNAAAKEMTYDPNTYYYTIAHTGDFDCSPWMKARVPTIWKDSERGNVIMSYSYNSNLSDRIPMAFDYIYENQTENDYILNHSGGSYMIPNALFQGFVGKEANPDYSATATLYRGTTYDSVVHRTLPDGDTAYYNYVKPYYDKLKTDVLSFLLCGFSVISPESMELYNTLEPGGVFIQSSTAGEYDVRLYDGHPYVKIYGVSGNTIDDRAASLRTNLRTSQTKFVALVYNNIGTNYATPSEVKTFTEAFANYVSYRDPGTNYQYVDVYTFMDLLKQSGKGTVITKD